MPRHISSYRCTLDRGKGFVYHPDGPFVEWRHVEDLLKELAKLRKFKRDLEACVGKHSRRR